MKTDHYERYIRESAEKTTKVGFYGAIIAIAAVLLFYSLDIYDLKLGGTLPWRAWGLFCAVSYLAMRPFLKSPKQQLLAFALMMAGLVAMMNGIAYLIFTNLESTQRQEYAVTAGSIMLWLLISMVSFGSRPYVSWAGGALMAVLALFLFFEGAKSVGFIMTIFMAAGFSIWAMRQQERQEKEKSTILYELEEREEKIARQRQELQNANENLVSFNYAITHDLKGPLRLAQSFAQLLERRIKAGDMEGLDEFFLQIKGSIGKVFQIIDDLLLLSRIGKGGLELEEVELEDMIRKIWEEQTADDSREKLTLRLHQELPYQLTVETEAWEERKDGSVRIDQIVYVARDGHKGIALGPKGTTIKAVGQAARDEIKAFLGREVHLFLTVKVRPNWMDEAERFAAMGLDFRDGEG
ncbi:MAG TPA: KH domain-containing protein [Saprospiraceae bacterium]|nr:KH domain-containing protein [Saprospiraceae bacterium]